MCCLGEDCMVSIQMGAPWGRCWSGGLLQQKREPNAAEDFSAERWEEEEGGCDVGREGS